MKKTSIITVYISIIITLILTACSLVNKKEPAASFSMYRPTIDERPQWEAMAKTEAGKAFLEAARQMLEQPMPDTTDALYLEFYKNGRRTSWEKINHERRSRVDVFAFAECLENKGRFIKALENRISNICQERTWVHPAHDGSLANFNGKVMEIDLASSGMGASFAVIDSVMGNRLQPNIRKSMRENVAKRILAPLREMLTGKRKPMGWMICDINWNPVCWSRVAAAAFQFAASEKERQFYVSSSCKMIKYYFKGFYADGYCKEGVGYWNYGFGHFCKFSELVRNVTGGRMEPLTWPEAQAPALFGMQSEIADEVRLTFGDCNSDPIAIRDRHLLGFLSRRFSLGLPGYENILKQPLPQLDILSNMLYCFPSNQPVTLKTRIKPETGLRTWFPEAGVLICRSEKGTDGDWGAAIKGGGSNSGAHHHNDIGSFIIEKCGVQLLCDPGTEVYTKATFSKNRFQSKVLNSFGHSVPVINQNLQKTGTDARGMVTSYKFTQDFDCVSFDLREAYGDPSLLKLERTFHCSRKNPVFIGIKDDFKFSEAGTFESAIMIFGSYEKLSDNLLRIYYQDHSATVLLDSDCGSIEISAEKFEDDMLGKVKPTRIAFKVKKPVSSGYLALRITELK